MSRAVGFWGVGDEEFVIALGRAIAATHQSIWSSLPNEMVMSGAMCLMSSDNEIIHALIHRGDRAGIEMLADRADVSFEEARGLMIEMFGSFLGVDKYNLERLFDAFYLNVNDIWDFKIRRICWRRLVAASSWSHMLNCDIRSP